VSKELLALADRVENLDGPSREVDVLIGAIFGLCPHKTTTYERCQGDSGYTCDECGADSWGNRSKSGQRLDDKIPAYTASLDAAMQLVPAGVEWQVNKEATGGFAQCVGFEGESWCDTPALALCTAALRARAALEEA